MIDNSNDNAVVTWYLPQPLLLLLSNADIPCQIITAPRTGILVLFLTRAIVVLLDREHLGWAALFPPPLLDWCIATRLSHVRSMRTAQLTKYPLLLSLSVRTEPTRDRWATGCVVSPPMRSPEGQG